MDFNLKQPTKKDVDKINRRGQDFNLARATVMNDALAKQNERDKMALASQMATQSAMTQQFLQAINGKLADVDLRQKLLDNTQKILTQTATPPAPPSMGMPQDPSMGISSMGYPATGQDATQYVPPMGANNYQ